MSVDLAETVSEILSSLIDDENYQSPIFLVCIGMSGNLMYFRYTWDPTDSEIRKCEKLTEHFEEQGLRCPVRLIFLDSATPRVEMLTIDSFEERAEERQPVPIR